MEVKLIRFTEEPEELLKYAYSTCYQSKPKIETVIKHLKHESVLEHVVYTFKIKISRVTWEQIVRHRIASYTAQSHRYTEPTLEDCYYFIPPGITELTKTYIQYCNDCYNNYQHLRRSGVSKQDARYVLPKGVAITAIFTMNLRNLINFLALRTAPSAQDEIMELAYKVQKLIEPTLPNLFPHIEELIYKKQEV